MREPRYSNFESIGVLQHQLSCLGRLKDETKTQKDWRAGGNDPIKTWKEGFIKFQNNVHYLSTSFADAFKRRVFKTIQLRFTSHTSCMTWASQ